MKRALFILLAASSLAWSDPLVYHTLPSPDCQLNVIGKATVITDARGFFVGYFRPRRPPAPPFTPTVVRRPGLWQGISTGGSGYDYSGGGDWSDGGGDCGGSTASCSSQGSSGGSDYASDSGSPLCSPDYGF